MSVAVAADRPRGNPAWATRPEAMTLWGQFANQHRVKHELPIARLEARAGIRRNKLSRLLYGAEQPTDAELRAIADALYLTSGERRALINLANGRSADGWAPEATRRLRKMRAVGHSLGVIAMKLGHSREDVAAKVKSLGLDRGGHPLRSGEGGI